MPDLPRAHPRPAALPDYAELHCLTNFTFLRGASHAGELVERAVALGYAALAITDECSFAGVVRAHVAAKAAGLPLIIGSELKLQEGPRLVLLATSRKGYGQLSALITRGRRRSEKGQYALTRPDLDDGLDECLALLLPGNGTETGADAADARWLAGHFPGRAWIAAELHAGPDDKARLTALRELSRGSGLPLTASGDVHMHVRSRRRLQDVLTAIRLRTPVAQCGHALFPNGERHLRHRLRLALVYPPELLAESMRIAGRCRFSLDELHYEYPEELVPSGETPTTHLRHLTEIGLLQRFPAGAPPEVRTTVEKELALIAELGYEAFFLTVHDVVRFARSQDILCQGRGSAANSAVCYALGITEVNPAAQEVLFERFVSRERGEPPDIDVDFEHQRREEVIQYIYAKYGRERAALAATVIRYRLRSALRDTGSALGLDAEQITRLTQSLAWWDKPDHMDARLREAGLDPDGPVTRQWLAFAMMLRGFPRHLSQHVGGFVISGGPLSELVPVENAAMPERSIIQWDKDDLESLRLLKVDVLALGMLSAIRRAMGMVNALRNTTHSMASLLLKDDPAVYAMICSADTVGVFQIESRAQMSMLPRLKPVTFYDLVVQIAIVRPGPIQGGMVHPYLQRRNAPGKVDYPSPAVRQVLERTLGVPIFQEQVMQLMIVAAGFSPGEADQLRRSMAAWHRKGGLEPYEQRIKEGMQDRGYSAEFSERIYRQILGFGEYGFPESHSASFALLAYVSAWLKHYEPATFLAALLNSQPMGFYGPAQLVQDARRHGVEVRAVDVMHSHWECTLEANDAGAHNNKNRPGIAAQPAARLGFASVRGLSQAAAERIIAARVVHPFESVADLAYRAVLDRRELRCLAEAGALAALAGHRRQAAWSAAGVETLHDMLRTAPISETAVTLTPPAEGADIAADYASLGLTLGRHPLALLRPRLARMGFMTAVDLAGLAGTNRKRSVRTAGIVTGRQRPGTASGTTFVTLEDETGNINVIVWSRLCERQRRELLGSRLMGVEGRLEHESGVMHLIATRLSDHTPLLGSLSTHSRDFH